MMNKRISLFILIVLTLSLFGSSPKPVHAQDWWNQNWSYRVTIEIDGDKILDDFTDFPVLVYLNSSRINWTHVQDDLDDLRFIDGDDITQLYAELENYTVNDEAWIWVKIPNVYSMGVPETNQLFYLYYGNNAVSSYWNPKDVWEASAVMVQHMTDNPDNAYITDSTQYDNDGIKKGADEPLETTSGEIDSAQSFDGSNDYVNIASFSNLPSSAITVSVWIKCSAVSSSWNRFVDHEWVGLGSWLLLGKNSQAAFGIKDSIDQKLAVKAMTFNNDIWYHVVGTYDGTTVKVYVDSVIGGTTASSTVILDNVGAVTLGGDPTSSGYFTGIIDEIRVYQDEVKSAEWIKADYNSGADTLLIYGAEELCPLALTIYYNTGIDKIYINGTQRVNNTTIYIDKNVNVNATVTLKPNFIFMKYTLSSIGASLLPTYIFNMTNPFTLWSYATPNFFIYEEPTTFTFTHWLILLFIALVISLLAAIKFHIIATVSLILVLYMVINVASYTGIILLAIIVWLLTIMFSIIAFAEI